MARRVKKKSSTTSTLVIERRGNLPPLVLELDLSTEKLVIERLNGPPLVVRFGGGR